MTGKLLAGWAAVTAWLLHDGRHTIAEYVRATLSARLAAEVPAPPDAVVAAWRALLLRLAAAGVLLVAALVVAARRRGPSSG